MPWQWSHTAEAYANAQVNLAALPEETLITIYAEWVAAIPAEYSDFGFNEKKYKRAVLRSLAILEKYGKDWFVDFIWPKMESLATCDSGGFDAWCCPWGCHTVSFSTPEELLERAS